MSKKIAVIDLGTNTFHLLIAGRLNNKVNILVRRTEPVKLGESGINDGLIRDEPFKRGVECMAAFADEISANKVFQTRAIATSAIRNSSNGPDFINTVKEISGISIEVIDGLEEARFIYQGIKASGCLGGKDSLIIDIGGGSVEFIICNANDVKWKYSFEIGAARMMALFHQTDPITESATQNLYEWLEDNLEELFKAMPIFRVSRLIGSSGSFETFAQMIEAEKGNNLDISVIKNYDFALNDLCAVAEKLKNSSHAERLAMKGIIPLRIDMIVTASILTRFIIEKFQIEAVSMSTYSLKEGVMAEMLGSLD